MDTSYLVRTMYQSEKDKNGKFYNRELAILDFNERVLTLTEDPLRWHTDPDHVKYMDIVYRNLIEFIQVRLPRCKQIHQEICLQYIQELFDEMERMADLADLEHEQDSNIIMLYQMEYFLRKELNLSYLNDIGCYLGMVERSSFDLYNYNGETDAEMLNEFIWLSSQNKVHPSQEPVAAIIIGPKGAPVTLKVPILYLSWSVIYALTWYRESNAITDAERRERNIQRFQFQWIDQYRKEFSFRDWDLSCEEGCSMNVISTPPRENHELVDGSYENTVVGAIEFMCELESVYLICMTLYRTAKKSRIVDALIKASMLGKKVMVYVEVMARGNEVANVEVVNRLRAAGVTVYHSFGGLKIHAKLFGAFLHNEPDFAILSTGNFNEDTAKAYTDMHYLTREKIYTKAIFDLFLHAISSHDLSSLVGLKPFGSHFIRTEILKMISREESYGSNGRIWLKCNSLCDRAIIRALYSAIDAGVDVRILIRTGIGVGDTSTLPVRSKVGEYLEHERIYIFGDDIYLSSADLMIRNLDRRVESFFKVRHLPSTDHSILSNFISDWESATTKDIHWDNSFKTDILNVVTDTE